eukprot:1281694-Pleurochrysis_carterae.AAC.1
MPGKGRRREVYRGRACVPRRTIISPSGQSYTKRSLLPAQFCLVAKAQMRSNSAACVAECSSMSSRCLHATIDGILYTGGCYDAEKPGLRKENRLEYHHTGRGQSYRTRAEKMAQKSRKESVCHGSAHRTRCTPRRARRHADASSSCDEVMTVKPRLGDPVELRPSKSAGLHGGTKAAKGIN